MYQMFTHAPAGTPSNAQPGARYTQQDMAFMAAMFPRQFAQAPVYVPPPVLQHAQPEAVEGGVQPQIPGRLQAQTVRSTCMLAVIVS